MPSYQWLWDMCKWMVMTERQQVASCLRVANLKPFINPRDRPVPTVDIDTRCRLEGIRDIKLDGHYPGLSRDAKCLALEAFTSTIRQRKYTAAFPMSQLHGFTASKSNMASNPKRASQLSMANMGRLVADLRDLKGLEDGELIDACMAWPELRLNQGVRLYTDNWHRRFYWGNCGGSHHMAVLCFQLQELQREWRPSVDVHEEVLDVLPLQQLSGKVSVFVVMNDPSRRAVLFERLPYSMQYGDIQQKLGVASVHFGSPWSPSDYQLILVDHSREYSDLSLACLRGLVDSVQAMRFEDFLLAWKGHGAPDQAPMMKTEPVF